jgi:nucleotide-binding universal stress UspA family protein
VKPGQLTDAQQAKEFTMHRLQLQLLVPTDFSTASEEALREAVRAAEGQRARITLLHVSRPAPRAGVNDSFDSIGYLFSGGQAGAALAEAPASSGMPALVRDKFEHLVKPYRTENLDLRYDWREGDVTEEILRFATENYSNVLYLGVQPEGPPLRFFPGITDRILRKAQCRVIVVRGARPGAGS